MKNENLKTSNSILKKLNETYYVTKRWECSIIQEKDAYDIYEKPVEGGLNFLFTAIVPSSRKKTILFNSKEYRDIDVLLKDVEAFNATRMFPSYTYDPTYILSANEEKKIHWYLTKKLGMEMGRESYHLYDDFGNVVFSLLYEMDCNKRFSPTGERNSTSGYIMHELKGSAWVHTPFDNAEDAVSKIDTFMATEITNGIYARFKVIEKMNGNFNSLDDAKITSMDLALKGQTISYKDSVIPVLEKLLKTLKGETN